MTDKETVLDWDICLSKHLQVLAAAFPDHFPPDRVVELKRDCFYGRLPKWLKAMVAYLKAGPQVRMYSDYLRAEKEDSIELSWSSKIQTTDGPSKLRTTGFFPLRKCKGNQPLSKKPHSAFDTARGGGCWWWWRSREWWPWWIEGVMEEFMVWLARAVKDAQADEKHCYHCSSPEHFIHNFPLMKTSRDKKQLNGKEGMAMMWRYRMVGS